MTDLSPEESAFPFWLYHGPWWIELGGANLQPTRRNATYKSTGDTNRERVLNAVLLGGRYMDLNQIILASGVSATAARKHLIALVNARLIRINPTRPQSWSRMTHQP